MTVQLKTVSNRSDPSDHWDEKHYETKTVRNEYLEIDEQIYYTLYDLDATVRLSDAETFIINTNPTGTRFQDDVETVVKVYDGYAE